MNASQTVQIPFYKITFDPNNLDNVYIASQYGVLKSTDGGNSWNITSLEGDFNNSIYEVSVSPFSSDTLYAGMIGWSSNKDLYRSSDKGITWTNLKLTNGEEGVVKILFDPTNPHTVYAAAMKYILIN